MSVCSMLFPCSEKNDDTTAPVKEDQKKEDDAPQSHPIENIVLVGKTGNGKSATGNSIVKQKVFSSKTSATGVTMECHSVRAVKPEGPILNVIDTPDLFDMSVSAEFIGKEIVRCLTLAEGGLHAVLLVLSARTRITQEEELVLSTLQVLFGSKIIDYLIVVFSGRDVLEDDGVTLEDYLGDQCPDFLKEENDRHKKEQEELESKGHTEEELKALRKELQLTNERNLKAMAEMMEKNIKIATEAQEKLFELREKAMEQSYHEKMEMQDKLNQMEAHMRSEMEAQIRRGESCNIL